MKMSKLVFPGITMIAVTYGLARFSYELLLYWDYSSWAGLLMCGCFPLVSFWLVQVHDLYPRPMEQPLHFGLKKPSKAALIHGLTLGPVLVLSCLALVQSSLRQNGDSL